MMLLFVVSILPILVAITGDKLLEKNRPIIIRAMTDSVTHGTIGSLSWLVVLYKVHTMRGYVLSYNCEIFLCGFLASVIDLDHFFTARSLRLNDAMSLGVKRPPLHASSILLFGVLPCYLLFKVLRKDILQRLTLLTMVAIGSHHIRDGVRRGLWCPPFGSTRPLPHVVYLISIGLLPHIISLLIPTTILKNVSYSIV